MKNLKLFSAAIIVTCTTAFTCNAEVITWSNSAGGDWNVPANWLGGSVPLSSGQAADIPLAVAVNVNTSPSIDSLSIDNSGTMLGIPGGQNLTVTDGIANDGMITVDSNSYTTAYLTFSGSQTLSGTGSVIMNAYAQLNTSNSGLLTQAAGHSISGQGTINAALLNQGLVNANVNGQMLSLATNAMTNSGTMEATNGGLLKFYYTAVNNAGGTILGSGGNVQITGGTVNNSGGGAIQVSGGSLQIDSGTVGGGSVTLTGSSNFSSSGGVNLSAVALSLSNSSQFNIFGGSTVTFADGGIVNNGTITVDANSYTNAYLTFSGSPTLSGTGSVILNAYAQLNTSNSGLLTQAAGHTISGQGTINAAFLNQGLVNANVNGQMLSLSTNAMTNSGTMEATNGGLLKFYYNAVNNAGGTILGSGGNVQITGGTVNNSGGGAIQVSVGSLQMDSGGTVDGGSVMLTGSSNLSSSGGVNFSAVALSLSNSSQFNIFGGSTVTFADGGIVNNGTITVDANSYTNAYLTFSGSPTLSGTGSVIMNVYSQIGTSNNGLLTQAAGHTISGQGTISAALLNQGVVNANINGQTLSLATNAMTNSGTMEATNGGLLKFYYNTVNNSGAILASGGSVQIVGGSVNNTGGGAIQASGGSIQVNSGGMVGGGSLTLMGSSNLSSSGGASFSGVALSLSGNSQFNIFGGSPVTFADGGIVNNGTITIDADSYTNASLTFSGSPTLSGTGSVIMNIYSQIGTSNNGLLTQAAGHTISGQGTINAAFLNQGLVNANVNGQMLTLATNAMTSSGTMEATNGGLLKFYYNAVNNVGGTILASGGSVQIVGGSVNNTGGGAIQASGGSIQVNSGGTVDGGSLTLTGSSNLSSSGGANFSGVALSLSSNSQFNIFGGSPVTFADGGIVNNGTITIDADSYTNASLTFSGSPTLSGTGSVIMNIYSQIGTSNNGLLTQAAGHSISGQGTISAALLNQGLVNANVNGQMLTLATNAMTNSGTMEATNGSTLRIYYNVVNNAGGTILASGGSIQINGGTVSGGTLAANAGALQLDSQAVASPVLVDISGSGQLAGTGEIQGANVTYESSADSTYAGNISGTGNKLIVNTSSGSLTLSGNNKYTGGTEVLAGTLIVAGNHALPDGRSLSVGADSTSIFGSSAAGATLVAQGVVAVPEPGTLALFLVGLVMAAGFTWRRRKVLRIG